MSTLAPNPSVLNPAAGGPSLDAGRPMGVQVTPTGLVMTGVIGVVFAALFHYFFYVQNFQSWTRSEDWGHAYFIPFVSLYLVWVQRAELARLRPRTFWPGLIPVLMGINCYVLFQVSSFNNHMLRGWSVILTLFGLALLFGGPGLMRVLFWPIGYLVFAVTMSDPIMRAITFRLQLLASDGAWVLLNMVGVQTDVKGNVLEVHTSTGVKPLNVAEACAGMRMVMGFVALGFAVALVATTHWWKRVLLILLAVPVALLMNVIRVATLGVLTLYDPNLAVGQSHMLVGTLLLVVAFFIYLGIVWALHVAVPEPRPEATPPGWSLWRPGPVSLGALRAPVFVLPVVVMACSAVAVPLTVRYMGIHLKKLAIEAPDSRTLQSIAPETENWTRLGKDLVESAEMVDELGTSNYLTRVYIQKNAPAGKRPAALSVHMAYYTGMIDTIPHIPERCLVGGGWEIVGATQTVKLTPDRTDWREDKDVPSEFAGRVFTAPTPRGFTTLPDGARKPWSDAPGRRVRLPLDPDNLAIRVTEFVEPKSGRRLFAGYFFIANGSIADAAEKVRLLAFDLRDDYAYYLKVQFSAEGPANAAELAQQASGLLGELLPEVMRCVPDWVDVHTGVYPPDNPRRKNKPER